MPAVYVRVLGRVRRVELVDQFVKPRGQDDDVSGRLRSGVAEGVRDARGHEHSGASPGDELLVPEPEPECPGDDVPGFVICVVDVQRRDFALYPVSRPVADHQGRSLDGLASAVSGLG